MLNSVSNLREKSLKREWKERETVPRAFSSTFEESQERMERWYQ